MDITQLILDDHAEQRRLFALLEEIDSADVPSLTAVWKRLSTFLEVHAEAEEKIFYPALLQVGRREGEAEEVEHETRHAINDHNKIRDAVAAVQGLPVGSAEWRAAVLKANEENGDHAAEEEREGLTSFRAIVPLELRHDLGVKFIAYEVRNENGVVAVDKDPERWIEAQGLPEASPA
ncbi:MAG: hemerythrin domain-containing protein [Novosphingobium sp.]